MNYDNSLFINHCVSKGLPYTIAKEMVESTIKAIKCLNLSNLQMLDCLNLNIDIFNWNIRKQDKQREIRKKTIKWIKKRDNNNHLSYRLEMEIKTFLNNRK